jgi:SAM-dependent methyltransferase
VAGGALTVKRFSAHGARPLGPGRPGDQVEITWAEDSFLEGAGVKAGKDVIYLPTPPMVIDKMIEMADISESDLVYDLGTGDGRIAIAAARSTGCGAIGFELDAELVKLARENVRAAGLEHLVTIEQRDILTVDCSPADVVLMYLNPDLNVRLLPQFEHLRDGARIVSHDWGMQGRVVPDLVVEGFRSEIPDFVNVHTLYRWIAPLGPNPALEK